MSESTNARNLATQQLEMLENELNGVYLDPSYGCPRVEYGSLFRHIMELRAEIARLKAGRVVVAEGTYQEGFFGGVVCAIAVEDIRIPIAIRSKLTDLDGRRVRVVVEEIPLPPASGKGGK